MQKQIMQICLFFVSLRELNLLINRDAAQRLSQIQIYLEKNTKKGKCLVNTSGLGALRIQEIYGQTATEVLEL